MILFIAPDARAAFLRGGFSSGAVPTWHTLPVGAGGFMRGMDIALADNTTLARSDTPPSLFIGNASTDQWQAILTAYSLPAGFSVTLGTHFAVGVWEARICPSNTSKIYILYSNAALLSTNRGASWSQLTNYPAVTFDANGTGAAVNYKAAVDPINDTIAFFGTPGTGLQKTANSGASFSTDGTVPSSSNYIGISFDPTSSTSGGFTHGVFALSSGHGVYHSTDGGVTWTFLNTTNMPTDFSQMVCDQNGKLWVADGSHITTWTSGGGWVVNSLTDNPGQIDIDPNNSSNVAASSEGGRTYLSVNGGTSWTTAVPITTTYDGSSDAPWITKGPIAGYQGTPLSGGPGAGSYTISMGAFRFDSNSNLFVSEGFGVLKSTSPFANPNSSITFLGWSRGIETLDTTCIIHPPNGNPVGTAWDLPIWNFPNYISNPTALPNYYGPDDDFYGLMPNAGVNGVRGWCLDYASSAPNPAFLTAVVAIAGYYSSNGGVNWTRFASQTPFSRAFFGGCIASSSTTNHIAWCEGDVPYFTTDNGNTWTACTYAGNQFTGAFAPSSHVCADRVTAGKFYIFSPTDGFYVSTNNGATFTKVLASAVGGDQTYIKAVPGNAGHVFWTPGIALSGLPQSSDTLQWTINSFGSALATLSDFDSVFDFSFGTVVSGQTYPTIYLFARRISTGVVGCYKCNNFNPSTGAGTWSLMPNADGSPMPLGYYAVVASLAGDPVNDNRCSIAYANGGFVHYA